MLDPLEQGEARCEAWFFDNVRGDEATCDCGRTFKLSEGETLSPNPNTIPVCPMCFEKACYPETKHE